MTRTPTDELQALAGDLLSHADDGDVENLQAVVRHTAGEMQRLAGEMEASTDLEADLKTANELANRLQGIAELYRQLPEIDLSAETEEAEKLLASLRAIKEEADDLPELP
jgi:hypothetical protein